jgi:hypothetical protein
MSTESSHVKGVGEILPIFVHGHVAKSSTTSAREALNSLTEVYKESKKA